MEVESNQTGWKSSKRLTCLSNLPGLVKAGSSISGKLVAAINIIPCISQIYTPVSSSERNHDLDTLTSSHLPHFAQNHPSQQVTDAVFS